MDATIDISISLPVSLLVVQRDYKILYANKSCHSLFGYEDNELMNKQLDILIPEKSRDIHRKEADKFWEKSEAKPLELLRNLTGVTKDNKVIKIQVGLYPYQKNMMVLIVDLSSVFGGEGTKLFSSFEEKLNKLETFVKTEILPLTKPA